MGSIPHRYPFLFVDRMVEMDQSEYAIGYKNVSWNDFYVYGCSSEKPRFPETLVAESMCQVGVAAVLSTPENRGKMMLFAAIDNLCFYRSVYPGDQLISHVRKIYLKGTLGKMKATAYVENQLVAEGEFTYSIVASASADSVFS